jgi:hypothetical protein
MMPTIQSRKYPDNEQFVTVKTWKEMEEKGLARRYRVVDDGDMHDTVIATPLSFTDFSKPPEVEDENDNPELDREELKAWLDEQEIEYNPRASTEKLNQLYIENQP